MILRGMLIRPQHFQSEPDVGNKESLAGGIGAYGYDHAERLDRLPGPEEILRVFARGAHVEFEFEREMRQADSYQFPENFAVRQFESFRGYLGGEAIGQAGMIVASGVVVARGGQINQAREISRNLCEGAAG